MMLEPSLGLMIRLPTAAPCPSPKAVEPYCSTVPLATLSPFGAGPPAGPGPDVVVAVGTTVKSSMPIETGWSPPPTLAAVCARAGVHPVAPIHQST